MEDKFEKDERHLDASKISYISLTEECYRRLKASILNDGFSWGERLDVVRISQEFGVSRSPVVKAVERLAHEGLVEIVPNKGSFVKFPSRADVKEITEVRIAFETALCELAYSKNKRRLLEELEENERLILNYEEKGDEIPQGVFLKYDRSFHQIFAMMANNQKLLDLFDIIRNQVELFRVKSYSSIGAKRSILMHRRVIDHLVNDQLGDAVQTLRKHIEEVGTDTLAALADG